MSSAVREGEILAGKYRVDRVLGIGGMGVVVAAHHLELDEKVALKFLLPETLSNAEAVARFAREARAAVKIKSEHVARVSDVGKLESGAPYMVMEYLEGSDLAGWLTEKGALPIEQAVEFTLQASEAIAEAHSLGIVHRDLKPANLFVIRRPDGGLAIKVLDFGISKMTSLGGSSGEGSMTKTSTMMGSPIYMSPEQIQSSKDVDARGDIWALGVILYELVTGSAPFGGEHMAELIYRIISAQPPRMQAYRADVPEAFERVVLHCLEKDRTRRFQSVAELAHALLPFAPQRALRSVERISGVMTGRHAAQPSSAVLQPVLAAPAHEQPTAYIGAAVSASTAGSATQASWGQTHTTKKRAPWVAVGVVGSVVLLAAGGIGLKMLGSSNGASATASAAPSNAVTAAEPAASPESIHVEPKSAPSAVAPAAPASGEVASVAASAPPPASAPTPHPVKPSAPRLSPAQPKKAGVGAKPAAASDPWGDGQH